MKSNHWLLTVALTFIVLQVKADSWIRINQLGYLPQSVKVAVFMSEEPADIQVCTDRRLHGTNRPNFQFDQSNRKNGTHEEYLSSGLQ